MRLVIQRVREAHVKIFGSDKIVGQIGKGLFVLVGLGKDDNKDVAEILAKKLVKLRILADKQGKMNLSVKDMNAEILVVSQFTLYSDTSGGNRPSFIQAAEPKSAERIYEHFVIKLKEVGIKVETGKFGAYMEIRAALDGPVTIII